MGDCVLITVHGTGLHGLLTLVIRPKCSTHVGLLPCHALLAKVNIVVGRAP